MITLNVTSAAGSQSAIVAEEGANLMEVLRDAGFEDLLALCGGCCSCATCHVYVESGPNDLKRPGSEDENDLLESCGNRAANSRLSCQIVLGAEHDSLKICIAPEG